MANEIKFRPDGEPDGRGHSEGSKEGQFKPGDGRERPGRPKGSKSLRTIYRTAGDSKIAVTTGGKTRKIAKKEALVLKQLDLGLGGRQRAAERFLDKVEQYSPIEVEPDLTAQLLAEDEAILAIAQQRGLIPAEPPASRGENAGDPNSESEEQAP